MRKIYALITIMQFLLALTAAAQVPGTLDTTFNGTGKFIHDYGFQDNLSDVKVQPSDQKIVITGTAITTSFSGKLLVARLTTDGVFDTTFNGTGSLIIPDFNESYGYECQIKSDGKILIAGAAADPQFQFSMVVLRVNEDGTIDSTFGTNGMVVPEISTGDDFANAMVEQPDHKIVLAGTALDSAARNEPVVVRLNENGSIDSTFGVNGVVRIPVTEIDNELNAVVIQPDGKIVVSGHWDMGLTSGGQFDFDVIVARFNSNGSVDSTFGLNGMVLTSASIDNIDDAFGMQLTADGNIVVSGFTTQPNYTYDALLLQYDSTGTLDAGFGNNGIVIFDNAVQDVAYDVELQGDGKILIGGTSGGFFFDDRDYLLARYNMDGSVDTTFGTNGFTLTTIYTGFDEANGMAIQQDGKIILAGKGYNGSQNDIAVTRHLNDFASGISEPITSGNMQVFPNPVLSGQVITITRESGFASNTSIGIYDLSGKEVGNITTSNLSAAQNQLTFQLPKQLVPGFYFLRAVSENSVNSICKILVTGN